MKGITLIELLLSLLIISFILLIFIFLTFNISNLNTYFVFNLGKQREIMNTIIALTKELRSMEQSSIGNYPLEKILTNQIIFYSNIDDDNLIERVRYFVDGNTLKKGIIKPVGNPLNYNQPEIVINMITDLSDNNIFSYYNGNNQLTSDINAVKIVKVNLSAKDYNRKIINHSFVVVPRNLRFK